MATRDIFDSTYCFYVLCTILSASVVLGRNLYVLYCVGGGLASEKERKGVSTEWLLVVDTLAWLAFLV